MPTSSTSTSSTSTSSSAAAPSTAASTTGVSTSTAHGCETVIKVYADTNQNGKQDADEPGVAGLTIEINGPNGKQTAVTNSSGSAVFGCLPMGDYPSKVLGVQVENQRSLVGANRRVVGGRWGHSTGVGACQRAQSVSCNGLGIPIEESDRCSHGFRRSGARLDGASCTPPRSKRTRLFTTVTPSLASLRA